MIIDYDVVDKEKDDKSESQYATKSNWAHLKDELIVGFHMTSLKFKLQNYRSYWDFTFMMYFSSWN